MAEFIVTGSGDAGELESGWSVNEQATPVAPGQPNASTGSVSLAARSTRNSSFLINDTVDFTREPLGTITGIIDSATVDDLRVTMTHGTLLTKLAVERTASATAPGARTIDVDLQGNALVHRVLYATTTEVHCAASTYVAGQPAIYVYDFDGNLLYTWGVLGTTAGTMKFPIAMDTDSGGNFFILSAATAGAPAVYKYSSAKAYITQWGSAGSGNGQFNNASGLTVAANDNVYVYDGGNYRVQRFDNSGTFVSKWGSFGFGHGQFNSTYGHIASDSNSNIYVGASSSLNAVQKFTASGSYLLGLGTRTVLGDTTGLPRVIGLTVDNKDVIYVVNNDVAATQSAVLSTYNTDGTWQQNTSIADISIAVYNDLTLVNTPINGVWLIQAGHAIRSFLNSDTTLSQLIRYYLYLVDPTIVVSYSVNTNPIVVAPGWKALVWDQLNALCAAYNIEMSTINGVLLVQDTATKDLVIDMVDTSLVKLNVNTQATGRNVDITYQNALQAQTNVTNRINLVRDPSQELGVNWSGALSGGAGGSPPQVVFSSETQTGIPGVQFAGSKFTRLSWSGITLSAPAGFAGGSFYNSVTNTQSYSPLVPLENYTFSAYIRSSKTQRIAASLYFTNKGGSVVGSTSVGTPAVVNAGMWTRVSVTMQAPAGAFDYSFEVNNVTGTGYSNWTTGDTYDIDCLLFERSSTVNSYFDGSYPGAYTVNWSSTNPELYNYAVLTSSNNNIFYDAKADNNQIYQVDAAATNTYSVTIDSTPTFLDQPTVVDNYVIGAGQYYVSGQDNLPVKASEWAAYGGSVTVAVDKNDPRTINITLVGPTTTIPGVVGPYTLSASDGTNQFATLSITGGGVIADPQILHLPTGADPIKTTTDIGATVTNVFINTLNDAYSRGVWAAILAAGPTVTISFTLPTSAIQGFGLTSGSLVRYKNSIYRVTDVQISNVSVSCTAERHVTSGDVEALWAGKTVADYLAVWGNHPVEDSIVEPLRMV